MRAAVLIGLLLGLAFGGLDAWLAREDAGPALAVRAVLLTLLVAAYWAIGKPWWPRIYGPASATGALASAVCFDLMTIVSPLPSGYAALSTMMLIVVQCTLMRATPRWTAVAVAAIIAAFGVTAAINGESAEVFVLHAAFLVNFAALSLAAFYLLERARRERFVAERELDDARARSDALLLNILPEEIADRLRREPATIADAADAVTVVFADIVGFTTLSARLTPERLVRLLDELFRRFDALCDKHEVEKIKTIGDAYMAVAGLPVERRDHASAAADLALDMVAEARAFEGWPDALELRVGLSSGPVVAGVIGQHKFAYDLWGDTVNTASRMESHGRPGCIQVSEDTRRELDGRYVFGPPRSVDVKGKGPMTTYELQSRAAAADDITRWPELP